MRLSGKIKVRKSKSYKIKRKKRYMRKHETTSRRKDSEDDRTKSLLRNGQEESAPRTRVQISSYMDFSMSFLAKGSKKRLGSLVSSYTYDLESAAEGVENGKCYQLMNAIENNNVNEISKILEGDIQPWDLIDFSSHTHVLHMAARFADRRTLDLLFENPEIAKTIDIKDMRGTTPLIAAAWYNNFIATEYFLERDADTLAAVKDTMKTALHCAAGHATDSVCRAILKYNKKKFFLDAVDNEGNTALMIAVGADSACIDALFKAGSDYRKKNLITGRNILHQAIVNRNYHLIRILVDECYEKEFLDSPDNNGDTPLMIAIRLEVIEAIRILMESQHNEMILPRAQLCLHDLVARGKTKLFRLLLDMVEDKSYFNIVDSKGRTVILHAVELCQVVMTKAMIEGGVNYKIRNYKTGETILHVAADSNSQAMFDVILGLDEISELMEVKDHSGITPCEIILAKSDRDVWRKFTMYGLIRYRYCNDSNESSLFIAAKNGNYNLVMSILLSQKFNHYYESTTPFILKRNQLLKLELQGKIYTSDLYLLLGLPMQKRNWQLSPEQEDLFQYNETGQNIFHACAVGDNVGCITLIYHYCMHYNKKHVSDFDRPDIYGNTPLVFALLRGCKPTCKFLMKKGADLSRKNKSNQTILEVMVGTFSNFQSLMVEVINECVTFDNTIIKKNKQYVEMKISYDIFCQPGMKQMTVLDNIFKTLRGRNNIKIIKSPVLEYFVMCKWNRIQKMVGFRFIMYAALVVFFSTYISFSFCTFMSVNPIISEVLGWIILVLSVVMILFSVPLIFFNNKEPLGTLIIIAAPLLIFFFIQMQPHTRLALEVGAAGVLCGWFAILIQGSISKLSFQIAMFFEVVKQVSSYLPMCLVILYAFSNCFFILFHDFFPFSNPFHSFLTTSVMMLQSENVLPVFNQDLNPPNNKRNMYKVFDYGTGKIDGKTELHGMVVEGIILIFFDILFNVCFLNMLIGLAVRSGVELELEGQMQRTRTYVQEIFSWEMFVESRFYKIAKFLRILWMMGVPNDLGEKLIIPTTHIPLSHCYAPGFNLQRLRQVASSVPPIPELTIPLAAEILLKNKSYWEQVNLSITSGDNASRIYNEKGKKYPSR